MKEFIRKVFLAVAPVLGVSIGIAVVRGADIPFPLALSWDVWPQWAVFAAVVYTFTALCIFIAGRVFGEAPTAEPHASQPTA